VSDVDSSSTTPQQRPRAAVHGRPRREYIVDQHEFAPGHFGLTLGGYAECPLDVLRPSGLAQPDLLRRGLDALERAVEHDSAAHLADDLSQQGGLIEATHPLPPPV